MVLKKLVLLCLPLLLVGCGDGSDGSDGRPGADGTNAADQIARVSGSLAPGETLTLSHALTAYDSEVTFSYLGTKYDAEEFSDVYQAVDIESAVMALEGYDPEPPYDHWDWTDITFLETASGFDMFALKTIWNDDDDDECMSFVKASLDEQGVRTGDLIELIPDTDYSSDNFEVVALPGGNDLVVHSISDSVEFVVFNAAGAAGETRSLPSHSLDSGQGSGHSTLTQKNEVVTCLSDDSAGDSNEVLQLYIMPIGTADALGTPTTVTLYDNATVTQTQSQDDIQAADCIVKALPGGGIAVLHESGTMTERVSMATFFDEDFAITSTKVVSHSYIGYADIACNEDDDCVFMFEIAGPDSNVYYKSNPAGTDTFGPHPYTDHEYDERSQVTSFADGTFMMVSGEDDSLMSAIWNIDENGVAAEIQLFSPISAPGYANRELITTGPYTAKWAYGGYNTDAHYTIDVHKNELKVTEADGSFTVTNQSGHTVDTSIMLVGVAPAT